MLEIINQLTHSSLSTKLYKTLSTVYLLCREYYLLIYAYEDFQELLVTAIVDTPPELDEGSIAGGPGFTIQRMGRPN